MEQQPQQQAPKSECDLLVNEATSATANIATQQQETGENVPTIIRVNSLNQHQPILRGELATKTNTQSQLSSVTELTELVRKGSFSVASSTTGRASTSPALQTGNTITAGTGAGLLQGSDQLFLATCEDFANRQLRTGTSERELRRRQKVKKEKIGYLKPTTRKLAIDQNPKMTDGKGVTIKRPVSILQELLNRHAITPSYELVQTEGVIHQPTFRYRVSFNKNGVSFTAMGVGCTKKEAKHSAARALIDKLTDVQFPYMQNSSASVGATCNTLISTSEGVVNAAGMENPVGWLQEMCMSRRWPPPTYETETYVGLPHDRIFTIACTILTFREVGKGKCKKIAKRVAARKMWTRLRENPLNNNQISELLRSEVQADSNQISETMPSELQEDETCLKGSKIDFHKFPSEITNENPFIDKKKESFNDCLVQLSSADTQNPEAQNALKI